MFSNYNEIMNVEEVMEALDIGRTKLYYMLRKGELKAAKIGKKWKISRDSLTELILKKCSE